jgi:NAD(P) transhydrogenase subunit alpha
MVAKHIAGQDLVITTAQIPGRPAPRLVSGAMVASMKPGSVLVDLAVESGGNVEGSRPGEIVDLEGVRIVGHTNVASRLAPATSSLYARNLFNFASLLIDPATKELVINLDDDLVKGTLITKDGKVVHPSLNQNQAA